jgi:hypothetical protein
MNREKLISDIQSREEDRIIREKEILKSLSGDQNKQSLLELVKHLSKFVRKMLMLTVIDAS